MLVGRQTRKAKLLVLVLVGMQCGCGDNRKSDEYGTSLTAGDTINITKYSVDRSEVLNPKKWQVFNVDNDVICLPVSWRYKDSDNTFFSAFAEYSNSTLIIKRYNVNDIPGSLDEVARTIYLKSFPDYNTVKSNGLNKNIYDDGTIYEAYLVKKKANSLYDQHLILFTSKQYFYQIELSLNKNAYNINTTKNILYNLKIDQQYVYQNTNKLKQVVILEK